MGEKIDDGKISAITNALAILLVSGRTADIQNVQRFVFGLKGKVTDEQIFCLLKQLSNDYQVMKAVIRSACLSIEGVVRLIGENDFDISFCEMSLSSYPGDDFARKLLDAATTKNKRNRKLLGAIEASSAVSAEFKMFLAIESGYNASFCKGTACDAATGLLNTIFA